MSKTSTSVITAALLIAISTGAFLARRSLGGDLYAGPGTPWRVTLAASGRFQAPDASLTTVRPPDFRRQHICDDRYHSSQLIHRVALTTDPQRNEVIWRRSAVAGEQTYGLSYAFHCMMGANPTEAMIRLTRALDGPPAAGADLKPGPRIESDHREITATAREVAPEGAAPADQVQALYGYRLTELYRFSDLLPAHQRVSEGTS